MDETSFTSVSANSSSSTSSLPSPTEEEGSTHKANTSSASIDSYEITIDDQEADGSISIISVVGRGFDRVIDEHQNEELHSSNSNSSK